MRAPEIIWGIEYWGPSLAEIWRTIKDNGRTSVVSYDFDKLPGSISKAPSVLNFLSEPADIDYSQGDLNTAVWKGESHFHLSLDVSEKSLNYINQFYRKITTAAAASYSLGGKVQGFQLVSNGSIRPAILTYGGGPDHLGLVVSWVVYEDITGKLTVGV